MKIKKYSEVKPTVFDGDVAKGVAGRVLIGKDDGATHFCMRMFELAEGGHTPKHVHDWEHEIFVHKGSGAVYNNGQWTNIDAGYSIFIPDKEEHQIKNMGNDPFVFICLIPAGAPEL
jgi:quercetin dioxygenase-like cupin family protein